MFSSKYQENYIIFRLTISKVSLRNFVYNISTYGFVQTMCALPLIFYLLYYRKKIYNFLSYLIWNKITSSFQVLSIESTNLIPFFVVLCAPGTYQKVLYHERRDICSRRIQWVHITENKGLTWMIIFQTLKVEKLFKENTSLQW